MHDVHTHTHKADLYIPYAYQAVAGEGMFTSLACCICSLVVSTTCILANNDDSYTFW